MNTRHQPYGRRRFLIQSGGAALSLLLGTSGCSKPEASLSGDGGNVDYYTCTMHPSVHLPDPKDKCPICGMNLVPVFKRGSRAADDPASYRTQEILLLAQRRRLPCFLVGSLPSKPTPEFSRVVGWVNASNRMDPKLNERLQTTHDVLSGLTDVYYHLISHAAEFETRPLVDLVKKTSLLGWMNG
jgi:hypothetical protein